MHTSDADRLPGSQFPREDFEFTVHSVFSRAVNVNREGSGVLLSLVAQPVQAHPRAAVILGAAFDTWGLVPGGVGAFRANVLTLGDRAETIPTERRAAEVERVGAARGEARERHTLEVAAAAVQAARDALELPPGPPGYEAALARAAKALGAAVRAFSLEAAVLAATELLGLGPGLTPAGDDFLCGALAGWRAQESHDPLLGEFLDRLAGPLGQRLAATGPISAAFLEEALAGRFARALVAFGETALGRAGDLVHTVTHLVGLGHTSGLDAAEGFLFALRGAP